LTAQSRREHTDSMSDLEISKQTMVNTLQDRFAHGQLDEETFEKNLEEIFAVADQNALVLVSRRLAVPLKAAAAPELGRQGSINLSMGNKRMEGDWLTANHYRIELNMSNVRMDFRHYENETGIKVRLDLDLKHSNIKIIVPPTFQVVDEIPINVGSNIKNKAKHVEGPYNYILLTGKISFSNVKVKYRRR
jgi:hypothetical protein